jgi:hypothetical protein
MIESETGFEKAFSVLPTVTGFRRKKKEERRKKKEERRKKKEERRKNSQLAVIR